MGSNQQPLDSKSNALPTELPRESFVLVFGVYAFVNIIIMATIERKYKNRDNKKNF